MTQYYPSTMLPPPPPPPMARPVAIIRSTGESRRVREVSLSRQIGYAVSRTNDVVFKLECIDQTSRIFFTYSKRIHVISRIQLEL